MSESVRRMKANKVIAGKRCGWCREELRFGEDAAICTECKLLHHAACWDEKAGCARKGCINSPLESAARATPEGAGPGRRLPPDKVYCRHCGKAIGKGVRVCPFCQGKVGMPLRRRRPERVSKADTPMSGLDWGLCILCSGIGFIVGIVALCQGHTKRGGLMILVSLGSSFVIGLLKYAAKQ